MFIIGIPNRISLFKNDDIKQDLYNVVYLIQEKHLLVSLLHTFNTVTHLQTVEWVFKKTSRIDWLTRNKLMCIQPI